MKPKRFLLCLCAIGCIAATGCSTQHYMNNSANLLLEYQLHPNNANLIELSKAYASNLNINKNLGVVQPGVFTEYAITLVMLGHRAEANKMFNNEVSAYPSSAQYVRQLKLDLIPEFVTDTIADMSVAHISEFDSVYAKEEALTDEEDDEEEVKTPEVSKEEREQMKQDRKEARDEAKKLREQQKEQRELEKKAAEKQKKEMRKQKEKQKKQQAKQKKQERKAKEKAREEAREQQQQQREAERKAKAEQRENERQQREAERQQQKEE